MKIRTNIALDQDTLSALRELAAADHTSMSGWITRKVWDTVRERDELLAQRNTNMEDTDDRSDRH